MARAVSEQLVCDLCGSKSRVQPYTIVTRDGARVIDLCPGDARAVRELWEAGSPDPRRKIAAKSGRPEQHSVVPVD